MNMGRTDSSDEQANTVRDIVPPPSYVHHDDVNISEEVSKTGIWHHLNSQSKFEPSASAPAHGSQPRHRFAMSIISDVVLSHS